MFVPDALYFPALIASGLIGFVVVMFVAFRRKVGVITITYAVDKLFFAACDSTIANNSPPPH